MITLTSIACLTCAKAFEHAGGNAAGYAILAMLVVLLGVLGLIGFFMVRMIRKSEASLDPELMDHFQDTAR